MSVQQEITPGVFSRFEAPSLETLNRDQIDQIKIHFLSRSKGIVMMDLDGHILDEMGRFDGSAGVIEAVNNLKEAGYLICLNSARNHPSLSFLQEKLGTDEPNFAEFGDIVDFPSLGWQIILREREYGFFSSMRQWLTDQGETKLLEKGFINIDVRLFEDEEPVDYIERASREGLWKNNLYQYGIYINGRSKLRLGLRAIQISDNQVLYSEKFQQAVIAVLQDYEKVGSSARSLRYFSYPEESVLVARFGEQNKTHCWRILLAFLGQDTFGRNFFHLGNSNVDDIRHPMVQILTVASANCRLKEKAGRVSDKPFAWGVADNLGWILAQD